MDDAWREKVKYIKNTLRSCRTGRDVPNCCTPASGDPNCYRTALTYMIEVYGVIERLESRLKKEEE